MLNTLADMNFHPVDWAIVVVYLALILAAGYYTNRFTGSIGNYLVAGRSVRKGLLIATFIGTEFGLVSIAAFTQAGFTGGFAAYHIGLLALAMCVLVGLTGFIVYRLRQAGVMTIPEYYEQRFGPRTRVLGGTILVTMGVLNMGQFLKAGGLFIGGMTGLSEVGGGVDFYVKLIMTILLGIVFAYVVLGGVISVVITDYLQFTILGIGFVVITAMCFNDVGWDRAVQAVAEHNAPKATAGFDPTVSDAFGWDYILWIALVNFSIVALWQPVTVRALIAASPKVAKQTYFWAGFGYLFRVILPVFWGTCALAFFMDQPELYDQIFHAENAARINENTLMATAAYLGELMPPVLLGLIAAGMLAAFMSTHDSYLLAWSSSLVQDVIAPLRGGEVSERTRILLTRIFIVVIGCFLLFWGLWYEGAIGLWEYMAMTGTIFAAGAFPVVVGGLYWRRASSTGAIFAMVLSLVGLLSLVPWSAKVKEAWPVLEIGNLGWLTFAMGILGMIVGSLLFPDRRQPAAPVQEVHHDAG